MTDNGTWQTMGKDRQWEMADHGEWPTISDYGQWGMTSRMDNRHLEMIDN